MESGSGSVLGRVDHLVYATRDLDQTVADLERRLGCRAAPGGQHPGRGTRNAIFPLGSRCYLEVVGPDPEQPAPRHPRWFDVDTVSQPRLVTWAANAARLEELVTQARQRGVRLGPIVTGSRTRPDGTSLRWRFTDPGVVAGGGLVPFLIDWGDSPHPDDTGSLGCTLVDLRAEHPEPQEISRMLAAMDLNLPVEHGPAPALIATLKTSKDRLELR